MWPSLRVALVKNRLHKSKKTKKKYKTQKHKKLWGTVAINQEDIVVDIYQDTKTKTNVRFVGHERHPSGGQTSSMENCAILAESSFVATETSP